jgi:hypothetical protein
MENGKLRFDGQIKWRKGENTLQWSEHHEDATTGRLIESTAKAVFGSGDLTTDRECRGEILMFALTEQRAEQFQMVRHIIMNQLWQALIDAFGYPTMKWGN